MTPILIGNRGIIKLGFLTIVIVAPVFFGGYLFGYEHARVQYLTLSKIEPLALPVNVVGQISDIEQQRPEVVEAGEIIDVDQADSVEIVIETSINEEQSRSHEDKEVASSEPEKLPIEIVASAVIKNISEQNKENINKFELTIATDTIRDIANYTIQVGMYVRLDNAEAVVKKLQLNNLNAYVSDYVNKKSEMRYNARFGYFVDKKSASSALKSFRKNQNGDGYLVNYTVDSLKHNLVTLENNQLSTKNTHSNAEVVSPEINQNVVFQTSSLQQAIAKIENVNRANVLMNTQAENPEKSLVKKINKLTYN